MIFYFRWIFNGAVFAAARKKKAEAFGWLLDPRANSQRHLLGAVLRFESVANAPPLFRQMS